MSWLDDLIGIGSGATSDLSPEQLISAGSDSWWDPSVTGPIAYASPGVVDFWDSLGMNGKDSYGNSFPNFATVSSPTPPGSTYPMEMGIPDTGYTPTLAQSPSTWDSFNTGLQKIGDFTGSKGGQFLMGGLGGLASYLDAKKKNALMKQMMEQAAAEKAAKAAKAAQYDAPARVTNMKTALPSWGARSQAFSGNSLKAMTPRSSGTMYAAEGGSAEAPKKTGVLDFLRFLATGEAEKQTVQQKEAARLEAERRAKMTPSELQAEKINNAYEDGRLQKATQRAKGGYIPGEAPGQSDKVPAMLSDGEFVMDADTVSALGDGNNAAGAGALEKMRQNIRRHKRSAPVHKIPPKAKKPEAYLKGAK